MIQNRQTCGKYTVFTINMDAEDKVEFSVADPNEHLKNLVSLTMLLEGECSLDVKGAISLNNQVTPFSSSTIISGLDPFDKHRTAGDWLKNTKVVLTANKQSIYLCASVKARTPKPVTYEIKDINLTDIPVSALFILTVDCGEYLKNKPYVNEITGLTLEAQEGKIIIVQEAE